MPTSTVPAVWQALYALVDTAVSVTVHNGPPMTESGDFVAVGYDNDGPAVLADTEWAALGQQKLEERYGLVCLIWCSSGDTDLITRVTTAYALLAQIGDALAADYTLGGACRISQLAEHTLTPSQDHTGSSVQLRFVVNVAKRIGT